MSSGSAAKENFTGTISAETRTVPPSAPLAGSAKLDLSSVPSSMASSANGTGSTKALSSRFLETIFEKTFGKKSAQELSLSSDKEWQSLLAQRRSQNEDAKRVADSVDDNDEKIDISVPTSATSSTSSKHAHQSDIKIAANAAAKTAELVSVLESERAWLEKERGVTLLRRPGLPTAQMRMERAAHERRRALEIAKSRDLIRSIYKKTVPRRKQELADDDPNRMSGSVIRHYIMLALFHSVQQLSNGIDHACCIPFCRIPAGSSHGRHGVLCVLLPARMGHCQLLSGVSCIHGTRG